MTEKGITEEKLKKLDDLAAKYNKKLKEEGLEEEFFYDFRISNECEESEDKNK